MSDSPRVLMVSPQPFFENRGMPISVFLRCEALADLGCRIDLITYPVGKHRVPSGTTIHRIPPVPGIERVPAGPSLRKLLLDVVLFFYLAFLLGVRGDSYDWIHGHEEAAFLCLPLARLFGLRLVYDHHSHLGEITEHSRYGQGAFVRVMNDLEEIALRHSHAVICVIPALEASVRERTPHDRMFVIPDTAPEELDGTGSHESVPGSVNAWIREEKITLVYTGSLAGYQSMEEFLEGLAKTPHRSSLQLLLVGGTERELRRIRPTVEALGLGETVRITGRVPGDQIPGYLRVADVLVSPRARTQNTPLKIYSYLWAGKPILASDVRAHRVVFGENDVLWAEPSPDGYHRALSRLVNADRSKLARTIEEKYENEYNFEQFTRKHRPFVESMAERKLADA